uniref:Uncharacterized protein n=1 Tax=Oryza meridionalis TaxID=40149 RepID=A0A0E0ERZ6_9ORYZ
MTMSAEPSPTRRTCSSRRSTFQIGLAPQNPTITASRPSARAENYHRELDVAADCDVEAEIGHIEAEILRVSSRLHHSALTPPPPPLGRSPSPSPLMGLEEAAAAAPAHRWEGAGARRHHRWGGAGHRRSGQPLGKSLSSPPLERTPTPPPLMRLEEAPAGRRRRRTGHRF